ncbi:non-specific lipid transfer protein GPI-anchored 15-like [Rutidosis leptorrhynchoides]|uniref:non-specific lipid transfer protein GPI-anchored 15-like n=1 Tax=Rutidosis leptorrhynchoides TaxID=125765 RepID=UPI003A9A3464
MAYKLVLAMVLIVSVCGGAMGQSGCTSALMSMSPCLNFITGNTSTPSPSCCSQLGNVVQAQPQCLCQLLSGNGINFGLSINRTLALTLPGACNVQTPPASQCNAANGPPATSTPSPAASPDGSSEPEILPQSPSESNTPSGSGSKTDGPTPNGSDSRAPLHFLAFVLFVVSWASTTASF